MSSEALLLYLKVSNKIITYFLFLLMCATMMNTESKQLIKPYFLFSAFVSWHAKKLYFLDLDFGSLSEDVWTPLLLRLKLKTNLWCGGGFALCSSATWCLEWFWQENLKISHWVWPLRTQKNPDYTGYGCKWSSVWWLNPDRKSPNSHHWVLEALEIKEFFFIIEEGKGKRIVLEFIENIYFQ